MSDQKLEDYEAPVELTKWNNAPTVAKLKQDLTEASSIHNAQVSKISTWLDNLNVTGSAAVPQVKGRSSITPKLIRKQAEWRYASLSEPFLSTEDIFNVAPQTWEDKEAAEQNQALLNMQFNCYVDKVRFIDEYIRTAVDEGTVICRTGWCFQEEQYEEDEPVYDYVESPDFAATLQEVAELQNTSPAQFQVNVPDELKQALQLSMEYQIPYEPVLAGSRRVKKTRVIKNHPTVEVCDYRNVIIDPTCMGNLDKAGFVIYRFESSMAELEKDGRYKNLKSIHISANAPLSDAEFGSPSDSKNFNYQDKPRKKFVVYEYWGFWDINGDGDVKPIVAAWVGDVLIRLEENPFPDKKVPFVIASYMPVRKSIYGEPDGALLEDNQKIMGATTRGMIDILGKSANAQTGIRKDMLDVTNRRKFDNGLDYEFNPTADPRTGIYMHTYAQIPQSAQFMLQLQNMEAESLTGVKSFSQGISGQSLGNVAAGVRGALDAASKRELGILRRLAAGIISIGQKFISMNSEFLSDEEVIRITNDEFITIYKDGLTGKFDIKLSISTAEEDDNKAQELSFMMQTMANTVDPGMARMILADIARLRKMPKLAQDILNFQPQPDPLAQRKAELEIALLEAQIANTAAQSTQREASAALSHSKTGTEAAKQNNLNSDTDQKNLDFVEQETGVKQARTVEAMQEQAAAQGRIKQMELAFKREEREQENLRNYLANRAKPV